MFVLVRSWDEGAGKTSYQLEIKIGKYVLTGDPEVKKEGDTGLRMRVSGGADKGAADWTGMWQSVVEADAADFHKEMQWVATRNIRTRRQERQEKTKFAKRLTNLAPDITFDPHSLIRAQPAGGGGEGEGAGGEATEGEGKEEGGKKGGKKGARRRRRRR